jgi:Ca-activated chloride channel family protein
MLKPLLRGFLTAAITAATLFPIAIQAQQPAEDEQDMLDEVVTTGMRVSQGGAQDINFFRGEVAFARIPHPETLTAEGLMSEHDIVFAGTDSCKQLFCLTGEASRADLLAVPSARHLVGVGFATNLDEKTWRRARVNLIAVVDKSGSMDGEPLELVRQSLTTVANQLRPGDQMTIVLYGDEAHVHLPTTPATRFGAATIQQYIASIRSAGSTSMEAGLTLGYEIAEQTAPAFKGVTRLMLFTDERPNTDATDAESFMGMAEQASHAGIGLTTIGVGVQFDAALATEISSVRGGNLYFIRNPADIKTLFTGQLDYMVSELAYDLKLTIKPGYGHKIGGIYGIPGELLGWQDDDVITATIPTVFLDNRGGGIFFTLMPQPGSEFLPEKPGTGKLADVSVTYLPRGLAARTESHAITIGARDGGPSQGMALGHLLIDEFTVLHDATSAHYLRNDQETAWRLISDFKTRLEDSPLEGLENEKELIASLHDRISFLSGHGGEPTAPLARLWGRWTIVQAKGETNFSTGETVEFTADNNFITKHDSEEYESSAKQIYLTDSEKVFKYDIKGDKLNLRHLRSNERIQLVRQPAG